MKYREERDTMGTINVPEDAYYGAQTQRAKDNFIISDLRFPPVFYKALGLIKKYAAVTNQSLGLLKPELADNIIKATEEMISSEFNDQFVVDVFQTGSGTSTNMNANEIIASRANELMTGKRGGKTPVHPNDHVNKGQSSNDVIPSAIHVAACMEIQEKLLPAMAHLQDMFKKKADEFTGIRKTARTHLQDAVPIGLGQIFSGYARQIELDMGRVKSALTDLNELPLGGTAVGTGVNTHPEFAKKVIQGISKETGCTFKEAENHFEAQAAKDAIASTGGMFKTYAISLIKIANDIRWLSSGPRCGLGELILKDLQPGSSIMPGKVNPVIPEAVLMVAGQVMGNDTAITYGAQAGNFELNVMMPMIAYNLLQAVHLLASASTAFADLCIKDITANQEKCRSNLEQSLSLATALVLEIGYDKSAAIAKQAHKTGKTVREVAKAEGVATPERIDELLDAMIEGSP